MRKRLPLIAVLLVFAFVVSACEVELFDKDKKNLKKACTTPPPALKTKPTLPGSFPNAAGIVYTGVSKDGPTTIAKGYLDTTIGPAHEAYSAAVGNAPGYSITKEEQDAADSEVNFAGNGKSGQVKMLQICKARTSVTITIRPA